MIVNARVLHPMLRNTVRGTDSSSQVTGSRARGEVNGRGWISSLPVNNLNLS
jgi:hypothetical protein